MNGVIDVVSDHSDYVEVDPSGRYGRYNEILGKGASKIVYKAFDEYEGIEVAWNQVKLNDFLQSPDDLERLYNEIHLLKSLKHKNIMKFYTSWVDEANRNINFVTEMFTSGTLRQYRMKHKRLNIRAVKHWCKQILEGLHYLHSHDHPVIHRDLKCDNIFINGNQGQVKIGDLGLAAILQKSFSSRCVGTPEFMAPEVFAEEYNELVDIYSFGMCILEMLTFEYPYSECTHPAQIYKKVTSGKKPDALYKVKDPEVREFVEKCLASACHRLSAKELLQDPFLHFDGCESELELDDFGLGPKLPRQPLLGVHHSDNSLVDGYCNNLIYEQEVEAFHPVESEEHEIDSFTNHGYDESVEISIDGRRGEDDGVFLRLRIADKEGRVRNIYFPFDVEADTALTVATEMVDELGISDQDLIKIANMIDNEIANLVPGWRDPPSSDEISGYADSSYCHDCSLNDSLLSFFTSHESRARNLQVLESSPHECGAVHGRFEEITYQFEGSEAESVPLVLSQSSSSHDVHMRTENEGFVNNKFGDEPCCKSEFASYETITNGDNGNMFKATKRRELHFSDRSSSLPLSDDNQNEIKQELRWLKAKYQMQLSDQKPVGVASKPSTMKSSDQKHKKGHLSSISSAPIIEEDSSSKRPLNAENKHVNQMESNPDLPRGLCNPEHEVTAKAFYSDALLSNPLHRTASC